MRILIVSFGSSIHTARWIANIQNLGLDIHLFPVDPHLLNEGINNVTVHYLFRYKLTPHHHHVSQSSLPYPFKRGRQRLLEISRHLKSDPLSDPSRLARTIRRLKPDIVHSMDMAGGHLTIEAKKLFKGTFPPWIHFSWGSDLSYFSNDSEKRARSCEMMASCDYFMADCQRELDMASAFGFRGESVGVFSSAGSFPIDLWIPYRQPGAPSARRIIALKGRHGALGGRGFEGLRVFQHCANLLRDYKIVVYLPQGNVHGAVDYVRYVSNLDISVLPENTRHEDLLRLFGSARISIALGMFDGTPHSMLESMALGAYPIQSNTADTRGWIDHGVNGHVVPPDNLEAIASALQKALADDHLVDQADQLNYKLIRTRKDPDKFRQMIADIYHHAATTTRNSGKKVQI